MFINFIGTHPFSFIFVFSVGISALQQWNWVVATETQRSFTEKFANLCFIKHFDKHYFPGIILTVCNIGKADNLLSILQIRKVCTMNLPWVTWQVELRATTQLWTLFIIILEFFPILLYCIYPGDAFVVARENIQKKWEPY